jgi:WD40 repeat protein
VKRGARASYTPPALFSASSDGTVRVWLVSEMKCLGILKGHSRMVTGVARIAGDRFATVWMCQARAGRR